MNREFGLRRFEDKPSYAEGAREASYYMSSDRVLDYLSQRPDLSEVFKEYIKPEYFKQFNDPAFRSSSECDGLKKRIDRAVESNKIANEVWKDLLPPAINDLKQYLSEMEIEVSENNIDKRAEGLAIVCLDLYRYWANIIRKNLRPDIGGFYMIEENLIGYKIPDDEKFDKISPEMQIENLKPVILHELIHALSYHNFWLAYKEVEENDNINREYLDFRGRRLGVSSARFGEPLRLNLINEAVTQRLAAELLPKFLKASPDAMRQFLKQSNETYEEEQKILNIFLERIDWKIFVKAYFDRDGLLPLAREFKEKFNNLIPGELDALMRSDASDYSATKNRLA